MSSIIPGSQLGGGISDQSLGVYDNNNDNSTNKNNNSNNNNSRPV